MQQRPAYHFQNDLVLQSTKSCLAGMDAKVLTGQPKPGQGKRNEWNIKVLQKGAGQM